MGIKQLSKRAVDVAAESTYATDPGSGRIALLPNSNISYGLDSERVTRDTVRGTLSQEGGVIVQKTQTLTVPLEFRGAGLDGSDNLQTPETDVLMKAANMTQESGAYLKLTGTTGDFERGETVSNDTASNTVGTVADWDSVNDVLYVRDLQNMPSASDSLTGDSSSATGDVDTADEAYVYRPNSKSVTNQDSVYARFDIDGLLHEIPGARASFSIDLSQGQRPILTYTLSGLYKEPNDGGPLNGDPIRTAPSPVTNANLILGALDMSLVAVTSVQMDIGNQVSLRQDIQAADGVTSQFVEDRTPSGSINPDKRSISEFNPYTDWSAANKVAVAAGLGSARGSRVRVVAPETEYTEIGDEERNGLAAYALGFEPTGDDNELLVIYS